LKKLDLGRICVALVQLKKQKENRRQGSQLVAWLLRRRRLECLMAGRRSLMAGRRSLMAGRRCLMAGQRFLMAGRRSLMAWRRFLMARNSFAESNGRILVKIFLEKVWKN
jgi:hypothetical protein